MTRAVAAPDVRSLVELLRFRAQVQTASQAYVFLTDGEVEGQSLSYGEVDRRSRAVAAALQAERAAGERVLLLYPPGLDFVAAFFGCLYAGVVAVPIPPPHPARPGRSLPRLGAIARDAEVRFVLTTAAIAALAPALARETPGLATACWVATDGLGETWAGPQPMTRTVTASNARERVRMSSILPLPSSRGQGDSLVPCRDRVRPC